MGTIGFAQAEPQGSLAWLTDGVVVRDPGLMEMPARGGAGGGDEGPPGRRTLANGLLVDVLRPKSLAVQRAANRLAIAAFREIIERMYGNNQRP